MSKIKFSKKTGLATFKLTPGNVSKIRKALSITHNAFVEFASYEEFKADKDEWRDLLRRFTPKLPERK